MQEKESFTLFFINKRRITFKFSFLVMRLMINKTALSGKKMLLHHSTHSAAAHRHLRCRIVFLLVCDHTLCGEEHTGN